MADSAPMTPEPDQDAVQLRRNAMEYWRSDGIPDIVSGVAWIIFPGAFCLLPFVPEQPTGNWGWLIGSLAVGSIPLGIVFGAWFSNSREEIIERIKTRLTYPRTGYVAPPSYWEGIPRKKSAATLWLNQHPAIRFACRLIFLF